jgi:hypothetical protein
MMLVASAARSDVRRWDLSRPQQLRFSAFSRSEGEAASQLVAEVDLEAHLLADMASRWAAVACQVAWLTGYAVRASCACGRILGGRAQLPGACGRAPPGWLPAFGTRTDAALALPCCRVARGHQELEHQEQLVLADERAGVLTNGQQSIIIGGVFSVGRAPGRTSPRGLSAAASLGNHAGKTPAGETAASVPGWC